jgi:hypothetical protein
MLGLEPFLLFALSFFFWFCFCRGSSHPGASCPSNFRPRCLRLIVCGKGYMFVLDKVTTPRGKRSKEREEGRRRNCAAMTKPPSLLSSSSRGAAGLVHPAYKVTFEGPGLPASCQPLGYSNFSPSSHSLCLTLHALDVSVRAYQTPIPLGNRIFLLCGLNSRPFLVQLVYCITLTLEHHVTR